MIEGRTVLIIDESRDNREVLRAVLESVGFRTVEARRPEAVRRCDADLVVVDVEDGRNGETEAAANVRWADVPQVVIGRARLSGPSRTEPTDRVADRCYLPRPFQYRDLIGAIESMLTAERTPGVSQTG